MLFPPSIERGIRDTVVAFFSVTETAAVTAYSAMRAGLL